MKKLFILAVSIPVFAMANIPENARPLPNGQLPMVYRNSICEKFASDDVQNCEIYGKFKVLSQDSDNKTFQTFVAAFSFKKITRKIRTEYRDHKYTSIQLHDKPAHLDSDGASEGSPVAK